MTERQDGWVDICTLTRVTGWATEDRRPATIQIAVNDVLVATLHCDQLRPDLAARNMPEGCGFAWRFDPPLVATDWVSVRFPAGNELNTSPRRPAGFDGYLDVCTSVRVSGWAIEDDHPAELDVFVDDEPVAHVLCDIPRPGLADLGLPPQSGFSLWLPFVLKRSQRVSVRFRNGNQLANSPRPPSPRDGQLERLTRERAVGWAIGSDQPAILQLSINDVPVCDIRCDQPRSDLAERGFPAACGFDVALPQPVDDPETVSIGFAAGDRLERLQVDPAGAVAQDTEEAVPDPVEEAVPGAVPATQRSRTPRILVRRSISLGDVILVTPVLARLRYLLGPDATLHVETLVPAVFRNNPHVDQIVEAAVADDYDRVIDLDLAYERLPRMHVIDAYMLHSFLDPAWPAKECWLYRAPIDDIPGLRWSRAVALHPARTWRNRTMPQSFWRAVIDGLVARGWVPVILGSTADFDWAETPRAIDLSGRLSIHQVATVIERSSCFVGNDSGLLHVAGTTSTPIVGLFTVAQPEYRLPWRAGILGWRSTALTPNLPCVGCLAEAPAPVVSVECRRGDYACVETDAVTPDAVLAAVAHWMERESIE